MTASAATPIRANTGHHNPFPWTSISAHCTLSSMVSATIVVRRSSPTACVATHRRRPDCPADVWSWFGPDSWAAGSHAPTRRMCLRADARPLRSSLPSTASSSLSSISCERNRYEAWSPWTDTVCTFGCPAARRLATSRLPWAVVALVPFAVFTPLAVLDALAVMTTTLTGICCAEAALHTVAAIWSASPPACSEAISRMAWPEDVATACPS